MNLPNKLTVLRICLVPVFIVIMMLPDSVMPALWSGIVGVTLFIIASLTDMLDGKIARKYGLVTDFGKLMDPLADKFMVIGALTVIVYRYESIRAFFIWALLIVVFRELAVTSLRLVAASSAEGVVVPANMLGKIKTCTQIACVICCIAEPMFYNNIDALSHLSEILPLSIATTVLMLVFTVWSGINYIASYWKYLDPEK